MFAFDPKREAIVLVAGDKAGKRSLANLAKRNISQLTALVKTRLKRMQYRPARC
jgi:hypothetical protein